MASASQARRTVCRSSWAEASEACARSRSRRNPPKRSSTKAALSSVVAEEPVPDTDPSPPNRWPFASTPPVAAAARPVPRTPASAALIRSIAAIVSRFWARPSASNPSSMGSRNPFHQATLATLPALPCPLPTKLGATTAAGVA